MSNTIPSLGASSEASFASPTPTAATDSLTSDFQTFLEMLTVQATNQDPLNPMDSSEYASQLASFSAVEQQVKTNELLGALSAQMGSSDLSEMTGLVGMTVRSTSPAAFDGSPIKLATETMHGADSAFVVVSSADGSEVQRHLISTNDDSFEWLGQDEAGAPLPAGVYSFHLESFLNGESLGSTSVESYQKVIEARLISGQVHAVLAGGAVINSSAITAVSQS